jgi:hypothetical protein
MANGTGGPITEMTEIIWDRIKNLAWSNGGWVESGVTKWLYPCANGNDFKAWFDFSDSKPRLLKLYMDQTVFNTIRGYTFDSGQQAFIDPTTGYKYRLFWENVSGTYKVKTYRI